MGHQMKKLFLIFTAFRNTAFDIRFFQSNPISFKSWITSDRFNFLAL